MPPSNALLSADDLDRGEQSYPLDLAFCDACGLAQITVSLDPQELFGDYAYFSAYSETMLAHARSLATQMIEMRQLDGDDLVLEIASNDGYLLQYYAAAGIQVLGIDPAENVVAVARERGVETLCAFFGEDLAEDLWADGRRARIVHANNVLAHVPDVNGVVRGMARVLEDDGSAVIETPYIRDLVERLEFDTIYHEHLFYYSLTSLTNLFERNGLRIVDVERIPIHGGSLRVFATPTAGPARATPAVSALMDEEARLGLGHSSYFGGFAARVDALRQELVASVDELKEQGHRIAAYGAAAKGAVMLNTCGIGADRIDFVVDRNEHKQGRFMPGVRIPIVAPERLLEEMPEEVLLLVWNIADEVLSQQAEYRRRGGRFLIPVPAPELV